MGYMSGQSAKLLRELRERTGLSMEKMAKAADMPRSTYQHDEDGYKGEFMKPDKFAKIGPALIQLGIPEEEVNKLIRTPSNVVSIGTDARADDIPAAAAIELDERRLSRVVLIMSLLIKKHKLNVPPEKQWNMYKLGYEIVREKEPNDIVEADFNNVIRVMF